MAAKFRSFEYHWKCSSCGIITVEGHLVQSAGLARAACSVTGGGSGGGGRRTRRAANKVAAGGEQGGGGEQQQQAVVQQNAHAATGPAASMAALAGVVADPAIGSSALWQQWAAAAGRCGSRGRQLQIG